MALTNSIQYLLDSYGQEYTLRYVTISSIDLDNPTEAPTTSTTDVTITAYPSMYKKKELDGVLIKMQDIKLIVGELETEPEEEDKIIQDSKTWTIKSIRPIYQKDSIIYHELQIRR